MIFFRVFRKVNVPNLLDHAIVSKISAKHGKTPAQVLLRFLTQEEIIVIPKSVTPERIKENMEVRHVTTIVNVHSLSLYLMDLFLNSFLISDF